MTPKSFAEHYKTVPDSQLLEIIENPRDYEASAVEAAKQEFSNRSLSNEEIDAARSLLLDRNSKRKEQGDKIRSAEIKVSRSFQSLVATINPIQSGIPTTDRTIRVFVIVFGILSVCQIIEYFGFVEAYIHDFKRTPYLSSFSLLPYIILPLGVLLFWLRKSTGWIFLVIYLTYSVVGIIWIWMPSLFNDMYYVTLDYFFPQLPPVSIILGTIFIIGSLLTLCKENMRQEFGIGKQVMIKTIAFTGVLSLLSFFMI